MQLAPDYRPDFKSLRDLLLEIAPERSVQRVLSKVVACLSGRPHVTLAAVWLIERGDACAGCPMQKNCRDRRRCLHLEISGHSIAQETAAALQEGFRRIPIGFGEIGSVAATGESLVCDVPARELAEFGALASAAGAKGFDAQPIIFQGEILGVILLLTRIPTPEDSPVWIRIFADHIGAAIANARAFEEIEELRLRLEIENLLLREEVTEAKSFGDIVGNSTALQQMLRQVERVARTDASVLILGESGTGKELVAREIHKQSRRNNRPLIRVNCASIPKELYESEFFGHAKGAFTGALRDRAGRFEAANGGTLFLDEVGEIPPELQTKFLRVLQEKQYERVGEERTRTVDVRIIAATNRNLKQEAAAGRFRQDLYYRLNVFPIEVAPLRARREDIPLLAAHFLDVAIRKLHVPQAHLSPAHLEQLQAYDWPGNVRELQNTIERALILAQNGVLSLDLPTGDLPPPPQLLIAPKPVPPGSILSEREFRERERENVFAALNAAGWKIHGRGGAAELLGLKPTTLISRIKKLGLKKPHAA